MIEIILLSIKFWAGLLLGLAINAQLLYPILYGLPRSIIWFMKGKIRFTGILSNIVGPIILSILIITFGFIAAMFFPSVIHFVKSPAFSIGQTLSIIILLLNMFKKGNDEDFRKSMIYFLKEEHKEKENYSDLDSTLSVNANTTAQPQITQLIEKQPISNIYRVGKKKYTSTPDSFFRNLIQAAIDESQTIEKVTGFTEREITKIYNETKLLYPMSIIIILLNQIKREVIPYSSIEAALESCSNYISDSLTNSGRERQIEVYQKTLTAYKELLTFDFTLYDEMEAEAVAEFYSNRIFPDLDHNDLRKVDFYNYGLRFYKRSQEGVNKALQETRFI